jgi:hypothetical protein
MIPPPPHSSLPSGHATEAFSFAYMLWSIIKESENPVYADENASQRWGEQLMRQASRIAVNRTVAGVHFPVDSVAGATLGLTLAQYFVARCKCADNYSSWKFNGTEFEGDFKWRALFDVRTGKQKEAIADGHSAEYVAALGPRCLGLDDHSPVLSWMWNEAKKEWGPE